MSGVYAEIQALQLRKGDVVVVKTANAEDFMDAIAAIDDPAIPDCPVIFLAPGESLKAVPREEVIRTLGVKKSECRE